MKSLPKSALKTIEITLTKNGFTVWITELSTDNKRKNRHWLLDASLLKEDGEIRLGNPRNGYKSTVEIDGRIVRLVKNEITK